MGDDDRGVDDEFGAEVGGDEAVGDGADDDVLGRPEDAGVGRSGAEEGAAHGRVAGVADGVERGVAEDDAAVAGPHGRRGVGDGRHGDDDGGGGGDVGGADDDAAGGGDKEHGGAVDGDAETGAGLVDEPGVVDEDGDPDVGGTGGVDALGARTDAPGHEGLERDVVAGDDPGIDAERLLGHLAPEDGGGDGDGGGEDLDEEHYAQGAAVGALGGWTPLYAATMNSLSGWTRMAAAR